MTTDYLFSISTLFYTNCFLFLKRLASLTGRTKRKVLISLIRHKRSSFLFLFFFWDMAVIIDLTSQPGNRSKHEAGNWTPRKKHCGLVIARLKKFNYQNTNSGWLTTSKIPTLYDPTKNQWWEPGNCLSGRRNGESNVAPAPNGPTTPKH